MRPLSSHGQLWLLPLLLLINGGESRTMSPFGVAQRSSTAITSRTPTTRRRTNIPNTQMVALSPSSLFSNNSPLLSIRGGAKQTTKAKTATGRTKVGQQKDEVSGEKKEKGEFQLFYSKMLPLTRIYVTMTVLCTMIGTLGGDVIQSFLALDPIQTLYGFQLWRPLTAASFLGPPSMTWIYNGYYLYQYGTQLERAYGTPQHLIFLFTQVVLLTALNVLLGLPYFTTSMVAAMLHVIARATPTMSVRWMMFSVPYWLLPYCFAVADVLMAQSMMAAVPHLLGMLTGHFYHFHKFIWPKLDRGGQDWLVAPDFVVRRLDPDAAEKKEQAAKKSLPKQRKKGRTLGTS
jgi:Derlin-1